MQLTTPLKTLGAADKRIQQLGDTMFEMLAERGECTDVLLLNEGFSPYELSTFGTAARNYANTRFVRYEGEGSGVPGADGRTHPLGGGRTERGAREEGFTKTDDEIVAIAVEAGMGLVGDAQIATAALSRGLTPQQIARTWPKILRKLAVQLATLPAPAVA